MVKRYRILALLPLLISSLASSAQLRVQNFNVANGLPQTQVVCIDEDSLGYLWVGTLSGGLARFDGSIFQTFTMSEGLPNNSVNDILIFRPDRVWVSTQKGVSFFDGTTFRNFDTVKGRGVTNSFVFAIQDTVFFMLSNGEVGQILHDSIYAKEESSRLKSVKMVLKTPTKTIVLQHNDRDLEFLSIGDKVESSVVEDFSSVWAVFDKGDSLMMSTDQGLFSFHEGVISGVLDNTAQVYGFDFINKKYIGIRDFILTYIPESAAKIDLKTVVYRSYFDREGTLWLGSDKGLFKIHPQNFENRLTDVDKTDPALSVIEHEKMLWVGTTYRGIKVYEENNLVRTFDFDDQRKNFVNFLHHDNNGVLWIGTLGGLAYYSHEKVNWIMQSKIQSAIDIAFDKQNDLLVNGEMKGLYRVTVDGDFYEYPEFSQTMAWAIEYNRKDDFFVVGTNIGLRKIVGNRVEQISMPEIGNAEISTLEWLDDDTLLVGTFGRGVFSYSFETDSASKLLDEASGLNSNTIYFLLNDPPVLWVGTEKGVNYVMRVRENIQAIAHYGAAEGLLGMETNLNAYYKCNNRLYFGLVDGLYTYRGVQKRKSPFRLHIDRVRLFYDQIPEKKEALATSGSYATRIFKFAHYQNHLTFAFGHVNKKSPDEVFYQYSLSGFDELWSNPSTGKTKTYGNLSPGEYSFRLRTTDKSGTFIYDEAVMRFEIVPAFYQTSIFRAASFSLIGTIIVLMIYYYQKRRVGRALYIQEIRDMEKTRLRKEIARDFHDELGNQVARMINFLGLAKISGSLDTGIYQTLNEYAQRILIGTKDFVWALDPSNDELNQLIIHLKDFGERMFSEKNIEFRFYGNVETKVRMPMGFSRQINLIFKEAMTNAFKHSKGTEVSFSVDAGREMIRICLEDNGVGIGSGNLENSQRGLANIKLRAKRIKAQLRFDLFGTGTRIELIIPRSYASAVIDLD